VIREDHIPRPDNHAELTELVEDGDDTVLYVDYDDKHFRRPMEPQNPDELRQAYNKREVQG
jgi:hypothetical protein